MDIVYACYGLITYHGIIDATQLNNGSPIDKRNTGDEWIYVSLLIFFER